jgi:DNA methylase
LSEAAPGGQSAEIRAIDRSATRVDGPALLSALDALDVLGTVEAVRDAVAELSTQMADGLLDACLGPSAVEAAAVGEQAAQPRRDVVLSELDQIVRARTLERARYYLGRLRRGLAAPRTSAFNDLNLARWKEHDEVLTDSLWIIERRDTAGAHLGWYWGNFIPQIPRQMMLRYTRRGDWVLDAFAGSGTSLIECRRLGRNGLGIDLNAEVVDRARPRVEGEPNPAGVASELVIGDSRSIDVAAELRRLGCSRVQLLLLHPPYHDIVRFSDDPGDLSVAGTVEEFLAMFGEVLDNVLPCLEAGRHCVVVIGDKFARGEWIPLGFRCLDEVARRGLTLKSIVVKNFDSTRGKRGSEELWRYRALAGGFYVFKHEYLLVFQKPGGTG